MATLIPPRSLANLGGTALYRPIGFHGRGMPGSGSVYDTTNNSLSCQTLHYAPASSGVKSIRLAFPGFDVGPNGEAVRNNTITGYASIYVQRTSFNVSTSASATSGATTLSFLPSTAGNANAIQVGMGVSGTNIAANTVVTAVTPVYDSANSYVSSMSITLSTATTGSISSSQAITFQGQVVPVKFGGKRQFTLEPMADFLLSDPVHVPITAGGSFMVRCSLTFASTGFVISDFPSPSSGTTRYNTYEGCTRGSSLADQTVSTVTPTNSGGGFWAPVVLGELVSTAPAPSVLIIGDSIAAGTGDAADANYRMGFVQRTLAPSTPYLSMARGGLSLANHQNIPYGGHYAAAKMISATDVILQLCRNDIWIGTSATSTLSYLQSVAAPYLAAGIRVWAFTCPPYTTSTDSWATLTNQTIWNSTRETERISYNTTLRANYATYGFAGLCDVAALWEDSGNAGKWRVDLGAPTTDGIHPSAVLHNLAVSSGVIPVNRMTVG